MEEDSELMKCLKQVIENEMTKGEKEKALLIAQICSRWSNAKSKSLFLAFILETIKDKNIDEHILKTIESAKNDSAQAIAKAIKVLYLKDYASEKRASV